MDSRNNFLDKFKAYAGSINDDYLIGVTNKGIFNRAVKDLGSGQGLNSSLEEDCVKCELPDGNTCRINDDISKFKCSCPSRSICKHAVMSYLYVRQHMADLFPGQCLEEDGGIKEEMPDYSELLKIDIGSIRKVLGDKDFGNIAKRLEFGLTAEIEDAGMLQVNFRDEEISVRFIPGKISDSAEKLDITKSLVVKNSICSCKSKELCRHRAEAVIHYNILKGIVSKEDIIALVKKDSSFDRESARDALRRVKELIAQIYITGLSRMPESCADELEQAAVICHNSDMPRLEKSLRAIKTELMLYLKKNASFSLAAFRKMLQSAYASAVALEEDDDSERLAALAGQHKTAYYDIPPLELYAAGARAWSSKSGYEGITYYFVSPGRRCWFTYTNSRPGYYEGVNTGRLLEESCPWNIGGKQSALCRSWIRLVNGKLNDEFRLSSSEESRGEILGINSVKNIALEGRTFNDWKALFSRMAEYESMEYGDREENWNLFLLMPAAFGRCSFDKILQVFSMPLYDKEGRHINISIKYTGESKRLIENIERAEKKARFPFLLLAEVYMGDRELTAIPITAYYENNLMENWTLE